MARRQESVQVRNPPWLKTQGRRHQKSKIEVSVAPPQKDTCPPKVKKQILNWDLASGVILSFPQPLIHFEMPCNLRHAVTRCKARKLILRHQR